MLVSTHSRPKAAGGNGRLLFPNSKSFNTQPPEGGWANRVAASCRKSWFQHTAARRRLVLVAGSRNRRVAVSTHSRPKAAGSLIPPSISGDSVSTHSRPKAAGAPYLKGVESIDVSTHSRPKAAGCGRHHGCRVGDVSTHSRPKAAGTISPKRMTSLRFQHTAARRRLGNRYES